MAPVIQQPSRRVGSARAEDERGCPARRRQLWLPVRLRGRYRRQMECDQRCQDQHALHSIRYWWRSLSLGALHRNRRKSTIATARKPRLTRVSREKSHDGLVTLSPGRGNWFVIQSTHG